MNKIFTLVAIAVAALGALPEVASAAETTVDAAAAPAPGALGALGGRFTIVDTDGRVVGELVSERADQLRLRVVGITGTAGRSVQPAIDPRADRTFHPDYSRALSPGHMSSVWQAELDRLFPLVMAGGG